jgi:hypothetical protein
MELDPELDMVFGGPPPPRSAARGKEPDLALGDALAALRPALCATLGIDESDDAAWADATDGALEEAQSKSQALRIKPARDSWVRGGFGSCPPCPYAGVLLLCCGCIRPSLPRLVKLRLWRTPLNC